MMNLRRSLTLLASVLVLVGLCTDAAAGLKCYQGSGAIRKEKTCATSDKSCSSFNYKGLEYLDCSTEELDGCQDNVEVEVVGVTAEVRRCNCKTDLCNDAKSAKLNLGLALIALVALLGRQMF